MSCEAGVIDCHSPVALEQSNCALYASPYPPMQGNGVLLGSGAVIGSIMAFFIGGNDCANSWASSVGSGAIPIQTALLMGGFAEWMGATLLGYGVSKTIEKGVAPIDDPACWACGYCDSKMTIYALCMLSALIGATSFLMLATFAKMPVSTTHSIVGGVVGMTIFGTLPSCLNMSMTGGLGAIIASWVVSPLLSGVLCVAVYLATRRLAVASSQPIRNTLRLLPVLYGLSTLLVMLLTLLKSKPTKHLPMGLILGTSLAVALVATVLAHWLLRPRVAVEIAVRWPVLASNVYLQAAGARAGTGSTATTGRNKVVPRSTKSNERSGLRLQVLAAPKQLEATEPLSCDAPSDGRTHAHLT